MRLTSKKVTVTNNLFLLNMEQLKCSLLEPTEGVNDTDNTYAEQGKRNIVYNVKINYATQKTQNVIMMRTFNRVNQVNRVSTRRNTLMMNETFGQ